MYILQIILSVFRVQQATTLSALNGHMIWLNVTSDYLCQGLIAPRSTNLSPLLISSCGRSEQSLCNPATYNFCKALTLHCNFLPFLPKTAGTWGHPEMGGIKTPSKNFIYWYSEDSGWMYQTSFHYRGRNYADLAWLFRQITASSKCSLSKQKPDQQLTLHWSFLFSCLILLTSSFLLLRITFWINYLHVCVSGSAFVGSQTKTQYHWGEYAPFFHSVRIHLNILVQHLLLLILTL